MHLCNSIKAFVPHAIRKKKKVSQQQPQPQQQQQQAAIKHYNLYSEAIQASQQRSASEKRLAAVTEIIHTEIAISGTKDESKNHQITNDNSSEPYLENEPESLRLLHASVKHPYDPHFPNDYLAYRERKKTEQVRKDLQRSALQRLDQQEKMRKKIEEERKKMLESGDLDKIVESQGEGVTAGSARGGAGRGRGRGRGLSNLPAWLLKQQQEQKDGGN